jgi:hypothetical protein
VTKPSKRKVPGTTSSGRVTPKAGSTVTRVRQAADDAASVARPSASTRYTPPTPAKLKYRTSSQLVPVLMFTALGIGLAMIIVNYMSVLLPGAPSNWYILGGLGFILSGIMIATQWR